MGKDKLRKFAEIDTFPNVYQLDEAKVLKGNWAKTHFKNENPVVLELACGNGEYSVGLARLFPEKNFIGIDLISHENIRPDRLIWNFSIDQF